jgi:hypothetical protein
MLRFASIRIFFTAIAFAIAPCVVTVSAAPPDTTVKSTRGEPPETVYLPDCVEISGP